MEVLEAGKGKEEARRECKASGNKESLKEQEHPNGKPSNSEVDFQIQVMTDEEAEKLPKELDMKCKVDISSGSSTKTPVAKINNGDGQDGKDGLQPNSDNGSDLTNRCLTQTLPEIEVFRSEKDNSAVSEIASKEEQSLKRGKEPLLLSPVIKCVLGFLKIEDVKNCRLICREWGLIGKVQLANRGRIHFSKCVRPFRVPVDFQSCFLNSATHFSAFKISGHHTDPLSNWTVEELTEFFDRHEKHIKELTLKFWNAGNEVHGNVDLSSWISKSRLVQKDAKYLTKLSIQNYQSGINISKLQLIAHIQDLSLTKCTVHLEAGIKICSRKLKLIALTFYQDGVELNRLRINDIVDLSKTKELALRGPLYEGEDGTEYALDLCGNVNLEKLILSDVELINVQTSEWVLGLLIMHYMPYAFNSEMEIGEIFLSSAGNVDLSNLPESIRKLTLLEIGNRTTIICSQPVILENLQYLCIIDKGVENDCSYLSHFMNCPKLTHLKLDLSVDKKINSLWIPKSVKTIMHLNPLLINWDEDNYFSLDKLVFHAYDIDMPRKLCENKIQVDDFILHSDGFKVNKDLVTFLEFRNRFSFCKRLCIGELKWDENNEIETSVLKDHLDIKSSFYVFEDGERGRGISKEEFDELIPKWYFHTL